MQIFYAKHLHTQNFKQKLDKILILFLRTKFVRKFCYLYET